MSGGVSVPRPFGAGPLARAAALVYTLLVVEALLLVTSLPGLVGLVGLDRDARNLPLVALCALPLGPALSAALYALHHRSADLADLAPAAAFWRGYRRNLPQVLRIWLPLLLWLTVIAVNLSHLTVAGVPDWWVAPLVAVAVLVVLAGVNALMITSLFTFRARDTARLALYALVRTPGVALGNAGVLIGTAGVTVLASEAVTALLGAVFVLALLHTSRPLVDLVRKEFTA